jgi:predicted RNA-binding protein with PIN domain
MAARTATANPLDGIERLLVDGSNLVHAIRRGLPAAPPATLIGRLRGVIEMPVRIELLFDGPPDPGLRDTRIASGVSVRYSGRLSADFVLARLVTEAENPDTLLVVTDDVELRHQIMRRGGHTASARWLVGRLERGRLMAPSVGRPSPPSASAAPPSTEPGPGRARQAQAARAEGADPSKDDTPDAPGWRPGRGATAKKGNPRRAPRGGPPRSGR